MNVFAKFDEIPSMILQDIKETKRYGHTVRRSNTRSVGRTDGHSDNVKTVYPPQTQFAGGIINGFGHSNWKITLILAILVFMSNLHFMLS